MKWCFTPFAAVRTATHTGMQTVNNLDLLAIAESAEPHILLHKIHETFRLSELSHMLPVGATQPSENAPPFLFGPKAFSVPLGRKWLPTYPYPASGPDRKTMLRHLGCNTSLSH